MVLSLATRSPGGYCQGKPIHSSGGRPMSQPSDPKTELEQLQAQLKAEQRKRRRLTVALAAALLLLLAGGSAAVLWYQHQQAERDKETAQRLAQAEAAVREVLKEAETQIERAQTLINQPASWQATLAAAMTAVRQAEVLLSQEPTLADGELREQVQKVKARVEADEK